MRLPKDSTSVSLPALNYGPVASLLFVSGAVALIYESVWQRQFALVFGSAGPATAAVLAAYFAGLGVGALTIGRRARHWSRPLRVYALLEMAIGLGALLVAPILSLFEQGYPEIFRALADKPGLFVAIRTLSAFAALVIPTFCMGGTLPLLGPLVDAGRKQLGRTAGWLYVVNTAGAGLGALSFPFIFLPRLGLEKTVWLCAGTNGLLAAIAWKIAPHFDRPRPAAAISTEKRLRKSPKTVAIEPAVLGPALISGIATFVLQVLWNRAFAQVHENSMYSFSVIVAVVIFSLAVGAQLARLGLRRGVAAHRLVGGAWILASFAVAVGPWLFLQLSNDLAYLPGTGGWASHALRLVGLATAILFVPMALLGIVLPAIMEESAKVEGRESSQGLGRVLGINVAGSVVGALAAGFVLPHWLGLWKSMLWLGALLLTLGFWQWRRWATVRQRRTFGVVWLLVWWVSLIPIQRIELSRVSVASDEGERLLSVAEGTYGVTAVVERPGSRRLKLNNHYGLGGTASTGDERMQAHVPLLLHPAPRSVAFLGLGTGITAGGALFHPVERVTVMELVPEVVSASRTYFRAANRGVLDDARVHIVQDDARHYLRSSGEHFDVIVGDLVVPWRQGEGSLFTLEQFTAARAALAPGGLFCQWLPFFQLSSGEVNILARTFLTVFPHAQVWRGDFSPTEPAIAFIGTVDECKWDEDALNRRLAEMKPDPSNPQLRAPDDFWMNWVGALDLADLPTDDIRLNREDRPWVEILGPMLHTGGSNQTLFTGRRLQVWLNRLALHSRQSIRGVPERESIDAKAGATLAELTLCLSEGDRTGALASREELRQMLPAEAFALLFQ